MRKIVQKTSFLGGEAGPLLIGRSDLAQFQLGCRRMQNFIAMKGGGVTRRPGTRYVKTTEGNKPARLIPFVFSHDNGADIFVLEIAVASTTSLTLKMIRVSDNTVYSVTGSPFAVAAGTFETSGEGLQYIQFAQSADVLFLVSSGFSPQTINRTAATPTFSRVAYIGSHSPDTVVTQLSLPYLDANVTPTTLSIDVVAVGAADASIVTASTPIFSATSVGTYYRMTVTGTEGYFLVTTFTDTTHVKVQVLAVIGASATTTTDWSEGAWSVRRGFPTTVTLYNQRLCFGGNANQRDTIWMSRVDAFFQMAVLASASALISDPVQVTLASNSLNQIRWMVGSKNLTVGTSSSEWVGSVTNNGTDVFIQFDEETTHGSSPVQPQKSAYTIPFVQRSGRTVREIVFDFYSNTFVATDLTLFSSHIGFPYGVFDSGNAYNVFLSLMAYQESPFNVLWVADSVGRLYGLTRDKQQQIAAWHSHVLGVCGTQAGLGGVRELAQVRSICVMPSVDGKTDRLWMVVQRLVNGALAYHVEYVDDIKPNKDLWPGSNISANLDVQDIRSFLDCATFDTTGLVDASNKVAWTHTTGNGFARFANDSAYVIASLSSGEIVYAGLINFDSSGDFVLPIKAQNVVVGLHAKAELRLLPIEGSGDGAPINMRSMKRVDTATVRLHETYGLKVGRDQILGKTGYSDNTTFESIPFDTSNFGNSGVIPTFTGVKEVPIPTSTETDGSFALVMHDPWPCTILAISSRIVTNES